MERRGFDIILSKQGSAGLLLMFFASHEDAFRFFQLYQTMKSGDSAQRLPRCVWYKT